LGLFGFVFFIVHSSLFVVHCYKRSYVHFAYFDFGFVWLCLGLFGFVFVGIVHSYLFVVHCFNSTYVHFTYFDFGFVLHKKG